LFSIAAVLAEGHFAQEEVTHLVETDRYFAGQAPWALKKTDPERMGTVVEAEMVHQIDRIDDVAERVFAHGLLLNKGEKMS
ncbi:hypothetical protein ACC785_38415, partial [Rhizobium ruizarguesonis]